MTALEMLEALQADCRQTFASTKQSAYAYIGDEIESVIDKLREEQATQVIHWRDGVSSSPHADGCKCPVHDPRHAPKEKHEHTPLDHKQCCSCGWICSLPSPVLSEQVIAAECARQHAEHVKE